MTPSPGGSLREITVAEAERFARDVLITVNADPAHAAITAESLVYADRSGIASHGLLRLPLYAEAAHQGGINTAPQLRWLRRESGGGLLEADAAFGQVAMDEAVRFALEELSRSASVTVAVQGSSHSGAGAFWVEKLAERGFIAVATSTTGPAVAPFGGAGKVLGTNPLSISLPTDTDQAMTVDMATSSGAYGKVVAARNSGEPIPQGWAVDAEGLPTTNPDEALEGALTPFGGHKGSGIAVALEGLSAVLGSAAFAYETEDIWINPASRMNVGHTVLAINPEAFSGGDHVRARTGTLRQKVRASGENVVAPGDVESASRRARREQIQLAHSTAAQLDQAAHRWGVSAPAYTR